MPKNPLFELQQHGQSVWYDSIGRSLIRSGGLRTLVDDYAVVGVTSNPTIFDKAISGSADYDEDIRALAGIGQSAPQLFEKLATDDVRMACDVLRPVYEQTNGLDGRVSIEVSPYLAFKTEETVEEARRLWHTVGRPNLLIKIPATREGIPAIQQMIYEGVSINVTLLFAVSFHEAVMEAYMAGLERRVAEGKAVEQIHSVASFFVSRVDTMVDQEISARIGATQNPAEQERLRHLLGKTAIANTKAAYQAFKRVFKSPRWDALAVKGANLQRPLWASTSTKNPTYPDTLYIAELIGPHTVNTIPESALRAFADHGVVRGNTIDEDMEDAQWVLGQLAKAGINLQNIVEERLLEEGARLFAESFDRLLAGLQKKRDAVAAL